MIKSIAIREESLEESILNFKTMECTKINLLFGGNGTGKSTLLQAIKNRSVDFELEGNDDFEILHYANSINNLIVSKENTPDDAFDMLMIMNAQSDHYSEGQTLFYWLNDYMNTITKKLECGKKLVVCLDEVDSGLSSENINVFLHILIDIVNKYKDNIQFFISFNNYHFVYVFKRCFNMYTGEKITINSYEDYFKILNEGIEIMFQKGRDFKFLNPIKR